MGKRARVVVSILFISRLMPIKTYTSFRVAEALAVIDWGDSSGDVSEDDSDHPDAWDTQNSLKAKGSVKGLHAAIAEGWLNQRARERCSFVHDRFFHAAVGYRQSLPRQAQEKMALRVCASLDFCRFIG